jgi:hypothetical protein
VLRLVEDRVGQLEAREELFIAAEQRVAGDDDLGGLQLFALLVAVGALPDHRLEGGSEALDLALPVGDDAGGGDDEGAELLVDLVVLP